MLVVLSFLFFIGFKVVASLNGQRSTPHANNRRNLDESYTETFNNGLYHEKLLYVDEDIIVVDKPPCIQTAPGYVSRDSLATNIANLFALPRIDKMIVHRLDYATSGVVVFARNDLALSNLHAQFRRKNNVWKQYTAIVAGRLATYEGEVDLPLGRDPVRGPPYCRVDTVSAKSKHSATRWQVRELGYYNSMIKLLPVTGRTHQLRLHMEAIGHPILGDFFYAPDNVLKLSERLLLHAEELRCYHPRTQQPVRFYAPVPFSLEDYDHNQ